MIGWDVTPHVCRECFGRVLVALGRTRRYRCAECGAAGEGEPESICACAMRLKDGTPIDVHCDPRGGIQNGVRQEVVVRYGE